MLQRLLAMFAADATEADGAACLVLERNRTPKLETPQTQNARGVSPHLSARSDKAREFIT